MTDDPRQTIMSKAIAPGILAVLKPDRSPPHPREDQDTISTIHTWFRNINLSDPGPRTTPESLLDDLAWEAHRGANNRPLPGDQATRRQLRRYIHDTYPGVLKDLHIYVHSGVLLSTSDFGPEPDAAQGGYVHVTPKAMLEHNLDRDRANLAIQRELRELQDYLNGAVYCLSVELDGETIDSVSGIYADSLNNPAAGIWQTQDLPCQNQLDQLLNSLMLPDDPKRPHDRRAQWDYL